MKYLIHALIAASSLCTFAESGRLVDLQIERRDGQAYQEFHAMSSAWVAGEQGEAYQLVLHNKTPERLLIVLSVDGVNAVSGKTAGANQTGYVLAPWGTTTVSGWRKSLNEVAQFYFTSLPDSYAARTDRPDNIGVIGAAVFRERRPPPPIVYEHALPYSSMPAPAAAAPLDKSSSYSRAGAGAGNMAAAPAMPQQQLGTGHGEIEHSEVGTTEFDRASASPAEVLAIRYDSRRNLVLAGILPNTRHPVRPAPFPADGFVPDPPRNPG